LRPLDPAGDWFAVDADRSALPELQAFYEANPEYWRIVYGHPPRPGEAESDFDAVPSSDIPFNSVHSWLIRDRLSRQIVGEVSVVIDLLAVGVIHLGFFIIDTARQGSGLASAVYRSYEGWATERGARWLRLGVVAGNRRAHAFWLRNGYAAVRQREKYLIGDRAHTLIVMVKPIGGHTFAEYLAAVPRDCPED
jgi:GNAT superfamily N-acetyltransferase